MISVPVTAASVFQASVTAFDEPIISESSALHFGSIFNQTGSSCALDNTGVVSGACMSGHENISVGVIGISGLVANQEYQIEVVGSDNGVLRYQPEIMVDSVLRSNVDVNQRISVTTIQNSDALTISIFGNLEVLSNLQADGVYQAAYTVNVNFQ
ncbi:DUF4402 domain-containing protein [Alteromonas gracilis]|uniref:DUF4402 domain-containing protein n=1 Tax=Alteromonas gracilis TaxID=1479524 RepID=UPI0037365EE9